MADRLYKVKVYPTPQQPGVILEVRGNEVETAAQAALEAYNKIRAEAGQRPLYRMPSGTWYIPQHEYIIQQYTGSRFGWEDVCSETDRKEAQARLREYRENQPEYAVRIKSVPLMV